jgi:cholest-4-en-3-one 26-monooxygenase
MTDTDVRDIRLLDGHFYAGDPYPTFAWMRHHAPAYLDEESGIWGISRYEDVRAIGQDPQNFSSAGGARPDVVLPYMIDMDAPDHRKRRRIVSAGFTPEAVRIRQPRVVEVCNQIIDAVCENGSCDLVADIAAPLPLIMIADMLGFGEEDWPKLLQWSETLLMSQGSPDPDAMERATAAYVEWDGFIRALIAERRGSGAADDLLGVLVQAEVDGERLDDDSLAHESLLILIGGDETTRHVISGGMEALVQRPEQFDALRKDRSLLPSAGEEMLRWVTPIKNMKRTTTRDMELHGRTIGAGQSVFLLYPSANRDETVFADPGAFDIARQPNDHLAFGFGAHMCLGNRLARAELVGMVDCLVQRLPDLQLAGHEPPPLRVSNFIVGYETMPVSFTPTPRLGS